MRDSNEFSELRRELESINHRLDKIENQGQNQKQSKYNRSSNTVWALIPIVAIIMWGLVSIF
ncbi:hypothetical protein GCM10007063_18430 [Lentibacillus kapialis]|uniref:Uncharacterized protein n=1 Tax=Lentibacillus kapialis TaxID=340214 RepID=A0A917PWX9_9BACI|nr:hypothetical protein GCM10007063_18430 [Lentibacillus kapialis]